MELKPKPHTYKTSLRWTSERKGIISCEGKPDIEVACAPEFGGHAGIWNPEDMFVGSVELCTMATFLWLADRGEVDIVSYESKAEGTAQMSESSMRFTELKVMPTVVAADERSAKISARLFEQIKKWCLITNTIVPEVSVEPNISVLDE